MIDYDEQGLFDATKQRITDAVSMLVDDGTHPSLVYAAMMSVISAEMMAEGFWGDEVCSFTDLRGFWNLLWRLQEKAFADLAADGVR